MDAADGELVGYAVGLGSAYGVVLGVNVGELDEDGGSGRRGGRAARVGGVLLAEG